MGRITKTIPFELDLNNICQEPIINSNQLLTIIPATTKYHNVYSRVLVIKVNDTIKAAVINMTKSNDYKQYSGIISITDLYGNFINGFRVKNGYLISKFINNPISEKKSNLNRSNYNCPDPYETYSGCFNSLEETVIYSSKKINLIYFFIYDSAQLEFSSGSSNIESWEYSNSGGGGGDEPANYCPNGIIDANGNCVEMVDDDYIFSDSLIGKEKCLNDLLDKNGNTYVQNLLKNFRGKSEYDINIVSKNIVISKKTGESINGKATEPINGVITIEISSSKAIENIALGVVKTILHEYIHADIYRKLLTKYTTAEDLDFRTTFEQYEMDHHEAMGALYVGEMTKALKNFHQNVMTKDYNWLSDNGTKSLDGFYEALAWSGLIEHNVKAYTDLPNSKKIELTNSLNTFYHESTKNCPD